MRVGVGIGLYGFWECGLGVWGGTGWVRGLVGQVLGLDGLCWGMGDWDLGLEGGAWAWLGGFWILAGCVGLFGPGHETIVNQRNHKKNR